MHNTKINPNKAAKKQRRSMQATRVKCLSSHALLYIYICMHVTIECVAGVTNTTTSMRVLLQLVLHISESVRYASCFTLQHVSAYLRLFYGTTQPIQLLDCHITSTCHYHQQGHWTAVAQVRCFGMPPSVYA